MEGNIERPTLRLPPPVVPIRTPYLASAAQQPLTLVFELADGFAPETSTPLDSRVSGESTPTRSSRNTARMFRPPALFESFSSSVASFVPDGSKSSILIKFDDEKEMTRWLDELSKHL